MVTLTPLETLQGALILTFVLISFILGSILILKYFKYKSRQFYLVGFTWIFLISPYWPDAISFVMIITTGTQLSIEIYLFIAVSFLFLVHIIWMLAFTDLVYPEKQKILMTFFSIEAVLFEIVFLYFFFTDISLIGTRLSPFYIRFALFIILYFLISIIAFTITGIIFALQCLKSEDEEIRLKAKFLILAFLTFAIGTFLDVGIELTELTLVIARAFVIMGAFSFYIGFTLPNFVKRLFIKNNN